MYNWDCVGTSTAALYGFVSFTCGDSGVLEFRELPMISLVVKSSCVTTRKSYAHIQPIQRITP